MKTIHKDDIADMGLNAVDKLVELGLIPNCTDTDDETEFEAQDAIREAIEEKFKALGYIITE